eukprot:COSAG01_NODE_7261_length_3278_cov_1.618119_4_plen_446_part_00
MGMTTAVGQVPLPRTCHGARVQRFGRGVGEVIAPTTGDASTSASSSGSSSATIGISRAEHGGSSGLARPRAAVVDEQSSATGVKGGASAEAGVPDTLLSLRATLWDLLATAAEMEARQGCAGTAGAAPPTLDPTPPTVVRMDTSLGAESSPPSSPPRPPIPQPQQPQPQQPSIEPMPSVQPYVPPPPMPTTMPTREKPAVRTPVPPSVSESNLHPPMGTRHGAAGSTGNAGHQDVADSRRIDSETRVSCRTMTRRFVAQGLEAHWLECASQGRELSGAWSPCASLPPVSCSRHCPTSWGGMSPHAPRSASPPSHTPAAHSCHSQMLTRCAAPARAQLRLPPGCGVGPRGSLPGSCATPASSSRQALCTGPLSCRQRPRARASWPAGEAPPIAAVGRRTRSISTATGCASCRRLPRGPAHPLHCSCRHRRQHRRRRRRRRRRGSRR